MPHRSAAVTSYLVFSSGEVQVQVQQPQQQPQSAEPTLLEGRGEPPLPENTPATTSTTTTATSARETSGEPRYYCADAYGACGAADHLVVTVETPEQVSSAERVDPGGLVAVELAATGSPSSTALHPQFCQGMGVSAVLPRRVMQHAGEAPAPPRVAWGQEGDECAICLGVMAAGEYVSDLPGLHQTCNHTFHLPCAVQWLTSRVEEGKRGCCPVCNTEVISPIFLVRHQPRAPPGVLSGLARVRHARVPHACVPHACVVGVLILMSTALLIYQLLQP